MVMVMKTMMAMRMETVIVITKKVMKVLMMGVLMMMKIVMVKAMMIRMMNLITVIAMPITDNIISKVVLNFYNTYVEITVLQLR